MSETVRKRVVVTFDDGLPLGVHGSFTYEGERWIAVPLEKHTAIVTVTDRLLGMLSRVRAQLTQVIGAYPDDVQLIGRILKTLATADTAQLAADKQKAQTS